MSHPTPPSLLLSTDNYGYSWCWHLTLVLTAEMVLVWSGSPTDLKLLMVLLGEADGWVGYHHSGICQLMPKQSSPILEAKSRYWLFWPHCLAYHYFINSDRSSLRYDEAPTPFWDPMPHLPHGHKCCNFCNVLNDFYHIIVVSCPYSPVSRSSKGLSHVTMQCIVNMVKYVPSHRISNNMPCESSCWSKICCVFSLLNVVNNIERSSFWKNWDMHHTEPSVAVKSGRFAPSPVCAPDKVAPDKAAPYKVAPDKVAPDKVAP